MQHTYERGSAVEQRDSLLDEPGCCVTRRECAIATLGLKMLWTSCGMLVWKARPCCYWDFYVGIVLVIFSILFTLAIFIRLRISSHRERMVRLHRERMLQTMPTQAVSMPTPIDVDSDLAARASATSVVIQIPGQLATADAGAHTVEFNCGMNDDDALAAAIAASTILDDLNLTSPTTPEVIQIPGHLDAADAGARAGEFNCGMNDDDALAAAIATGTILDDLNLTSPTTPEVIQIPGHLAAADAGARACEFNCGMNNDDATRVMVGPAGTGERVGGGNPAAAAVAAAVAVRAAATSAVSTVAAAARRRAATVAVGGGVCAVAAAAMTLKPAVMQRYTVDADAHDGAGGPVEERIIECERNLPFKGFAPGHLFPNEPNFRRGDGSDLALRTKEDLLLPAAWTWLDGDWSVLTGARANTSGTDSDGWMYAFNWAGDDRYVSRGGLKECVRRRIWIRRRVPLAPPVADDPADREDQARGGAARAETPAHGTAGAGADLVKEGGVYWHHDCADGMDKQVKVLSIDSAATPPSVVIDIDGREHTTVATNLSLHPT